MNKTIQNGTKCFRILNDFPIRPTLDALTVDVSNEVALPQTSFKGGTTFGDGHHHVMHGVGALAGLAGHHRRRGSSGGRCG